MAEPLVTAKLTPATLRLARLIAAHTGERQYQVVHRVLATEASRLDLLPPSTTNDPREKEA